MALFLICTTKVIGILPGTGKTTPCPIPRVYLWLRIWQRKYDEDMHIGCCREVE